MNNKTGIKALVAKFRKYMIFRAMRNLRNRIRSYTDIYNTNNIIMYDISDKELWKGVEELTEPTLGYVENVNETKESED